jgi:N-acetyl-anhydromuramyl-L-alanine amidase AmpD
MSETKVRDRKREQREQERLLREQERERARLERQQARLEGERPNQPPRELLGASPGTETVGGNGLGGALPVVAGGLGAPTGTIPEGEIGGGGPWAQVNRFDATFVAEGRKHGVPPAMLKSMMIVETGGKNVTDGHGATGVMQIKPIFWDAAARAAGYDLGTDEGQVGMAAAILGGSVPGVRGNDPTERFLYTYYPVLNADGSICYHCKGESGHTPQMYLDDIDFYTRLINEASGSPGSAGTGGAAAFVAAAAEPPANIVWVGTDNRHDRRGQSPVAIVYHVTDDMSYANVSNWFRTPGSNASAHFVIDRDGTPYQFVSTREAAWTNGDYSQWNDNIPWLVAAIARCEAGQANLNDYTVNLEFVGKPDQAFTEEQVSTAIGLTRYLLAEYPTIRPVRGHLLRHADINGESRPYCPGPNFPLGRIIEAVGGDPTAFS